MGFEKNLELTGVGYRAAMKGKDLQLNSLGYSHEIIYQPREGITFAVPSRPRSRSAASTSSRRPRSPLKSAAFRPPEPYKGKGVRYVGEYVRRKEGKKK
jgi:large subunit ribosomal protein L6